MEEVPNPTITDKTRTQIRQAMAPGFVVYFSRRSRYGHIDSPELHLQHIFFHGSNCQETYKQIQMGDEVSFELDLMDPKGYSAKNIVFIKNASVNEIKQTAEHNVPLIGYLKKRDGNYMVKDSISYVNFPLIVASYETDLEEVYEAKLDTLIQYRIIPNRDNTVIRAINVNRRFLPEYDLLTAGNRTEGTVVNIVSGGYEVKVYDCIIGFLPNSFARKSDQTLTLDQRISVTMHRSSETLDTLILDLTNNVENEARLKHEKADFTASLKRDDRFAGKVRAAVSYGLFINLGPCVGLLHMKTFIQYQGKLTIDSQKRFQEWLQYLFPVDEEIDVVVDQVDLDRIQLK